MVDPISIGKDLVAGILKRVKEARANKEECSLLGKMAEKTQQTLDLVAAKKPFDPPTTTAIKDIVEALEEVDKAIKACCSAYFPLSVFCSDQYATRLKHAFTQLQHALTQAHLALFSTLANIQEFMLELSEQFRQAQKETQEQIKQEMKEVKKLLLEKFSEQYQQIDKLKQLLLHHFEVLRKKIKKVKEMVKEGFQKISQENMDLKRLLLKVLLELNPESYRSGNNLESLNNEIREIEDNNDATTDCLVERVTSFIRNDPELRKIVERT